jgi:hypothetical protein
VAIILDGDIGVTAADVAATTLSINAGYGSVAPAYGCRAWVNFNGTGTVAIRESANVSSITDNGVGNYTVNFTTAMVDANYSISATANLNVSGNYGTYISGPFTQAPTASAWRFLANTYSGSAQDPLYATINFFR